MTTKIGLLTILAPVAQRVAAAVASLPDFPAARWYCPGCEQWLLLAVRRRKSEVDNSYYCIDCCTQD